VHDDTRILARCARHLVEYLRADVIFQSRPADIAVQFQSENVAVQFQPAAAATVDRYFRGC
jgi:hypothetical protein